MVDGNFLDEMNKRRTFAIISHPDAGKTTLTEKLLLYGGAIQLAGSVKGRKASRHATSDWMALEQERGISVTSSVMQFDYQGCVVNLLDTPGHEDFSEDTYRTLTAVDAALMVVDGAKGVEARTRKLWDVCALRKTAVMTFVNKLDRESMSPIDLLDNIESQLRLPCSPVTWPIGMGKQFKGIYHLISDQVLLYHAGNNAQRQEGVVIDGLDSDVLSTHLDSSIIDALRDEIELVRGATHEMDLEAYRKGELSPVFFGSAINNFGVSELLSYFVEHAPAPLARHTQERDVSPSETAFSGFVFKVQANMDPQHRDRIAFMRICSGQYQKGIKLKQVRTGKLTSISNAMTFMAGERSQAETAYPGDIIGLHNHGTIQVGDTFTGGEALKFTGIPHFAPELFRVVRLRDPLRAKALQKGLIQLAEEGATQVFRPLNSNLLILGAVGTLQFDVVAHRLKAEYGVDCVYDAASIATAHWVVCDDEKTLSEFKKKAHDQLALDGSDQLAYLAPTRVNLNLAIERWPAVSFLSTREV